jgi:hypothetical protein
MSETTKSFINKLNAYDGAGQVSQWKNKIMDSIMSQSKNGDIIEAMFDGEIPPFKVTSSTAKGYETSHTYEDIYDCIIKDEDTLEDPGLADKIRRRVKIIASQTCATIRSNLGEGFDNDKLRSFDNPHGLLLHILVTVGGGNYSSYMNAKTQAENTQQIVSQGSNRIVLSLANYTTLMQQIFSQINSLAKEERGQKQLADYEKIHYHQMGLIKRFDLFNLGFEPRMMVVGKGGNITLSDKTKPYESYLDEIAEYNTRSLKGLPDINVTSPMNADASLANAATGRQRDGGQVSDRPRVNPNSKGKDIVLFLCSECHKLGRTDHSKTCASMKCEAKGCKGQCKDEQHKKTREYNKDAKSISIKDTLPVAKQAIQGVEREEEVDWPSSLGFNATSGGQFGATPIDDTCSYSQFNRIEFFVPETLNYSRTPSVLNADNKLTKVTAVGTAKMKNNGK